MSRFIDKTPQVIQYTVALVQTLHRRSTAHAKTFTISALLDEEHISIMYAYIFLYLTKLQLRCDSRAALPNSYPNALCANQGGSLYHF